MALTRPRYSQIYDTDYKQSVRVATTADVGNLLATGNMTNTVDGKLLAEADRILVKDQSDAKQNGIYKVLTLGTGSNGTWIRTTDADANGTGKVTSGMTTTVAEGDINISKTYKLSTPDPITIGVTELTFINPFASSAVGTDKQIPFNDGGSNGASANLTFDKSTNTLTVSNAAVLTQIVGSPNVTVSGSMLPSANITYDLGSPTQRWREGWFSGSTIHIGDESISVDNNGKWTFTSDGAAVELGTNTDFNPPNANISGNVTATNYLFANGTPVMTVVGTMISVANTAMKGYADSALSTLTSNAAVQSGDIATLYANAGAQSGSIVTANTAMKGYVDGEISTTSSAITTANTAMKGYVDGINSTLTSNAAVQAGLIASKANLSGATFTGNISVPYIVGSTVIDGNLNISGNLNVTGVETIFNTNNLVVNDSLIYLADDNAGDVLDIGIVSSFTNPTYQHTGFVRDAGDGVWKLFANVVAEPTTTIDFTNATYSNLRVGNLTSVNTTLTGNLGVASVNATNLYGTIRTAAQTNITSVGNLTSLSVADVTSVFGNLNVSSKLGIGGPLNSWNLNSYVTQFPGGALESYSDSAFNVYQNLYRDNSNTNRYVTTNLASWYNQVNGTHNFYVLPSGTAGSSATTFTNALSINNTGNVVISASSASTSTSTGALIVNGGVGIAGDLNVGTNITTPFLVSTGGATINEQVFIDMAGDPFAEQLALRGGNATAGGSMIKFMTASETTGWIGHDKAIIEGATYDLTLYSTAGHGAKIYTGGNATPRLTVSSSGNVAITTTTASTSTTTGALTVAGGAGIGGAIYVNSANLAIAIGNGGSAGTGNIGATGAAFNTIFAKSTSAQYADLAEVYTSDRNYIPGTVLVFGGAQEVTVSTLSHDPSVAGVVSTNPAYLMNDTVDGVAVALQGRVPCRVQGPVKKGDRVVSSDVRGVAERLDMTKYQPGCIIGKSLDYVPNGEIATIEVVVGRN